MNKYATHVKIILLCAGIFVVYLGYTIYGLKQAFGVKDYRVVQILESPDGKMKAKLIRQYRFLDLNFIIELNDRRIFTSPDFKPNYKIPFRETLLWDVKGEHLVLEIGGRRICGYSTIYNRRVSDEDLLSLKVQEPKLEDFGYAGDWPVRKN